MYTPETVCQRILKGHALIGTSPIVTSHNNKMSTALVATVVCLASSISFANTEEQSSSVDIAMFPPKYLGTNIDVVLEKIKKITKQIGSKGEFETKDQYQKRIDSVAEKFGSNEEVFVFSKGNIFESYDPDSEAFVLHKSDSSNSIDLRHSEKTLGSYMGSNAYGAKTLIKRVQGYSLDLVYDQKPFNYYKYQAVNFGLVEIKVNPSIAMRLKGNIAVAYTVKLEAPYYNKSSRGWGSPTFSDPVERTDIAELIYITPIRIDVFEFDSGKKLKTFELDAMLPEWKEQHEVYEKCSSENYMGDYKSKCKRPGLRFSIL